MTRSLLRLEFRRALCALPVALCLLLLASPVAADIVRDGKSAPAPDARAVFELVRRAFEQRDQQVLADLVHADGLRVRRGASDARVTEYSPSQSFYFFKNLLQSHRTVSFTWVRMGEAAAGARVHAMALWTHRGSGEADDREVQLVFVLGLQGGTWRLAEITTIG